MNETQEKKTDSTQEVNKESDLDNFYRGVYRRGARKKTSGNITLFIVVALLVVIVVTGMVFAIKTFMPADTKRQASEKPVEHNDVATEPISYIGFEKTVEKYQLLDSESLLSGSEEDFVFNEGVLNYCQTDLDGDDEYELFMITSLNGFMPEMAVYEKDENSVKRNAYYFYADDLIIKSENAKSEIYISETEDGKYVCIEKYCFDDFSWEIEILSYDNGFTRLARHRLTSPQELTDEISDALSGYGIEYTIADYSEASELKMNGDTEDGKNLLCSFKTEDGKLEANIG